MASSFDKVCQLLVQTPDFSQYVASCAESLDNANIAGWEFQDAGDSYNGTLGIELPHHVLLIDWGRTIMGGT